MDFWPLQLVTMEGIRSTIPIFIFSSLRDLRGCSFSSSRLDFSLFRVRIRWGETAVHDALAHLLASSSSQARLPLSGTAVHLACANSFVSLFRALSFQDDCTILTTNIYGT